MSGKTPLHHVSRRDPPPRGIGLCIGPLGLPPKRKTAFAAPTRISSEEGAGRRKESADKKKMVMVRRIRSKPWSLTTENTVDVLWQAPTAGILFGETEAKKFKDEEKPKWAKKDIRDYNDADLERLLDQWEEDEEPLEPDELPEHLRPQQSIDFSKVDMSKPENLLKISKKGKALMMFVSTAEDLSRDETETITKIWQTGLWNNHIQAERYMIDDNRAIFMFKDGSLAWEAKDFLIEQEKCKEVTIENMSYKGKHSAEYKAEIRAKDKEVEPQKDEL